MSFDFYEPNNEIINLSIEIGKLLGVVDSTFLRKPDTKLRRANQVKTIHSSLAIEGNTLSEKQVTAIIDNKRVLAPEKDIIEVKNAIKTYEQLKSYNFSSINSYLNAHNTLMKGLVKDAGKFRKTGVGVFKGSQASHIAPPAWNVKNLMKNLFKYLRFGKDNFIIKSCVFHYEMEFIHPFIDGNGRMGRLWQTVILLKENPVFEFLPIEHEIRKKQKAYYKALELSDKSGKCTVFITYMLKVIKDSLELLVSNQSSTKSADQRIAYFIENFGQSEFVRKDYLLMFKNISTATASRDLKMGIEIKAWKKIGNNRLTNYKMI